MIKKIIAKLIVPKHTPYCHYRFKYNKKYDTYIAKSCPFLTDKNNWEYCKYLNQELSIQDQVKDCDID